MVLIIKKNVFETATPWWIAQESQHQRQLREMTMRYEYPSGPGIPEGMYRRQGKTYTFQRIAQQV